MEPNFFAPEIESLTTLGMEGVKPTPQMYNDLKDLYQVFSAVLPGENDEYRCTWLEVERGPISAFDDYEELKECGEVNSMEEFVELWKSYYPDKTKWYKFDTAKYQKEMFFYFNSNLFCKINEDEIPAENTSSGYDVYNRLVKWLLKRLTREIEKLKENATAYNNYISQNLSYHKRVGRIKRSELWNILGDEAFRVDKKLGIENVELLHSILDKISVNKHSGFDNMTANKFYEMCELSYDANNYFKDKSTILSPKEKYLRMADGRDAGLRDIDGDSPKAFSDWYHSGSNFGAHPWEICRGGNSTHISLFVTNYDGKWKVRLAGSSEIRVEETVRMALALNKNNIPFELTQAKEIYEMVSGNDFIGIVPEHVTPRYCHSFFPSDDNIIDFMNLGFETKYINKIIEKSYWYPLTQIILK